MLDEVTVFLHIGSNEGDRLTQLDSALTLISKGLGEIVKVSSIYETAAWGVEDQPSFLNQAIMLKTRLAPHTLLKRIHGIEQRLGRTKRAKWTKRVIDIDILFFGEQVVDTEDLVIPHPHLQNRNFVLQPMLEIAPAFKHPLYKKTIAELASNCKDSLAVNVVHE